MSTKTRSGKPAAKVADPHSGRSEKAAVRSAKRSENYRERVQPARGAALSETPKRPRPVL